MIVYEDPDTSLTKRIEELEQENGDLRRNIDLAQRELHGRSPSKKKQSAGHSPKKPIAPFRKTVPAGDSDVENATMLLHGMALQEVPLDTFQVNSPVKTPGKKQR